MPLITADDGESTAEQLPLVGSEAEVTTEEEVKNGVIIEKSKLKLGTFVCNLPIFFR